MIDIIHNLKISYHDIYKDIDYFINVTKLYSQKNMKLYKIIPSKQIIMTKPKERYVIDVTYIPIDLINNKKIFIF